MGVLQKSVKKIEGQLFVERKSVEKIEGQLFFPKKIAQNIDVQLFSREIIVGIIVGRLLRRFDDYPDDY